MYANSSKNDINSSLIQPGRVPITKPTTEGLSDNFIHKNADETLDSVIGF